MKVRMRFKRSFWLQDVYILFLIFVVSLAYHLIIAAETISSPTQLQERLQAFYYTLLYSLAGIVVLIAPALTASAISFERERRTLDLLLITPLRPMQILSGKLLASWAYLLLLLVLSMPMVTVCIIMGGASISDLLATYTMLSLSTLSLCAFSLYCSACSSSSGLATFWAYLGVILASLYIFPLITMQKIHHTYSYQQSPQSIFIIFPIASIHPLCVPYIKSMPTEILGVRVPCWAFCSIFSLLISIFWLTASAARLPIIHNKNYVGSLRKQGLMLCILAALSFDPAIKEILASLGSISKSASAWELTILSMLPTIVILMLIIPFIPWISTFGEHNGKKAINDGWFRPLRMFQPVASGALPFIIFWFMLFYSIAMALLIWRAKTLPNWEDSLIWAGYCALLLSFFWAIGRFWSALIWRLTPARWLTFGTTLSVFYTTGISKLSPIYPFIWLLTSASHSDSSLAEFKNLVLIYSAVIFILTAILFLFSHIFALSRLRAAKV
ncbi:MAG: ABC transporter permease [Armatimonadetes bacterium]|nr:ABC transporter permease [Armatimonadota bacterium]